MAKGSDDLVKYITQQVVVYMDTPKEQRKPKPAKEHWAMRWFGYSGYSLVQWMSHLHSKSTKETPTSRKL